MVLESNSPSQTRDLGAHIAGLTQHGDCYALIGDLGTGKTEFVRGFMGRLSCSAQVRSPSFSIINVYQAPHFPVYHCDFYRMSDETELYGIGIDEYLGGEGVCLIEWADMFSGILPDYARYIYFAAGESQQSRIIRSDWVGEKKR